MTVILLLNTLLVSVSSWYTLPAPPDSAMFTESLAEEPVEVLVFLARSGWNPVQFNSAALIVTLLEQFPSDAAVIAWTASLTGVPFETEITPLLIEYGDIYTVPDLESIQDDHQLLDAFFRRIRHTISAGEEPDEQEIIAEIIIGSWSDLPPDTKALSLEVLGKLGIDISGDIQIEQLAEADLRAAARYYSELGREYAFTLTGTETPLERIYAAACSPPEEAAAMLSDPLWAVRYNAVRACDPACLEPLLGDSIAYVSLAAALARRDAGYSDGIATIREIALIESPVGYMASEELGAADTLLLKEFMTNLEPGRRIAAQTAWLNDSLPVDSVMEEIWISDPYWLVPISWAWHLVDISDSLQAETVLRSIHSRRESYTATAMIDEYVAVLHNRLEGIEEEESSEDSGWAQYLLPFNIETAVPDTVIVRTDAGDIWLNLWGDTAPIACSGFLYLAENGYYDGIRFHRVIPGFVAQAGCPEGVGTGGPGYNLPNERNVMHFGRGVLGMADAGLNTAGSQFFIMLDDHGRLDGRYTAFGCVQNTEFLDEITVGTIITEIVFRAE
ncbi:MAG: peptidylprolyl isomerase [Candidatus Aegiribacteria sp.]|nr:peptidylprolyl isomerase [Candidatus Aegiribacteria sp.]